MLDKQKATNQPNQTLSQFVERSDPLSLDCKNTYLFVERLEKDEDTEKDVDADRDRTGRPVVIGQPTGSFTHDLDCHMQL